MNDINGQKSDFKNPHAVKARTIMLAVITCIICVAVLKITASFLLPFIIALFLALALYPLLTILSKIRVPRYISILLVTGLVIAGLFFIGLVIFTSGVALLRQYPIFEARFMVIYKNLAPIFDLTVDEHLSFFENLWAQAEVSKYITSLASSISGSGLQILRDMVMVVLFMVFLLFEAVHLSEKIQTSFEGKTVERIKKVGSDIVQQISRYLSIKFILSLVTSVIIGFLLLLVGLEFALIWGFLQFLLNFIPVLGSIVIGVIVSVFALVQFWPHDPNSILLVVLIMLSTNMVIGNVIDPKITGDSLGLSPIIILFSLVSWGFIWGFAGMVLSVPMTVIIKIVCEAVPALEPISILLGSRKAVRIKKTESTGEAKFLRFFRRKSNGAGS